MKNIFQKVNQLKWKTISSQISFYFGILTRILRAKVSKSRDETNFPMISSLFHCWPQHRGDIQRGLDGMCGFTPISETLRDYWEEQSRKCRYIWSRVNRPFQIASIALATHPPLWQLGSEPRQRESISRRTESKKKSFVLIYVENRAGMLKVPEALATIQSFALFFAFFPLLCRKIYLRAV